MTGKFFAMTVLIFVSCFIVERSFPGWKLPKVKSWPFRVVLINLAQLGVIQLAGLTWEKWLNQASLFHVEIGAWQGGFLAYFIATFIFIGGTGFVTLPISCGERFTRSTTARNELKSRRRFTSTRLR